MGKGTGAVHVALCENVHFILCKQICTGSSRGPVQVLSERAITFNEVFLFFKGLGIKDLVSRNRQCFKKLNKE